MSKETLTRALTDNKLSAKAKGFFALMSTVSDSSEITTEYIMKHTKEPVSAFHAALQELTKRGYLTREIVINDDNRIYGYEYTIVDY